MGLMFYHKPDKNNNDNSKYNNYAIERIERKVNKITDLLYSFLSRK